MMETAVSHVSRPRGSASNVGQRTPVARLRATLLTPEEVRAFSQLRPERALLDVLLCWGVILGAWTLVAYWPVWWLVALAVPVIGSRYYGLFIIGHDGLHRRVFPSQKINDRFCDWFIYGPIGAITRLNKQNHLLHHQFLSTAEDPDRHRYGCFNKHTRAQYLFFFTGLRNVVPAVAKVFFASRSKHKTEPAGFEPKADSEQDLIPSRTSPGYVLADLAILVSWQIALVGGLSWSIAWWAYPVLWLLPVYAFTYCADLVRTFLEHSHPEADEEADAHRLITYTSFRLERMFFAPMNMNYHAVHHLWTSIPYYNLPAADRRIRRAGEAAGLHWRGSYLAYIIRYYLTLPLDECRPEASPLSSIQTQEF